MGALGEDRGWDLDAETVEVTGPRQSGLSVNACDDTFLGRPHAGEKARRSESSCPKVRCPRQALAGLSYQTPCFQSAGHPDALVPSPCSDRGPKAELRWPLRTSSAPPPPCVHPRVRPGEPVLLLSEPARAPENCTPQPQSKRQGRGEDGGRGGAGRGSRTAAPNQQGSPAPSAARATGAARLSPHCTHPGAQPRAPLALRPALPLPPAERTLGGGGGVPKEDRLHPR